MSVAIAYDPMSKVAVMYCTTTDTAFGPIFTGLGAEDEIDNFLNWLKGNEESVSWAVAVANQGDGTDPRHYSAEELERVVKHWRQVVEDEAAVR